MNSSKFRAGIILPQTLKKGTEVSEAREHWRNFIWGVVENKSSARLYDLCDLTAWFSGEASLKTQTTSYFLMLKAKQCCSHLLILNLSSCLNNRSRNVKFFLSRRLGHKLEKSGWSTLWTKVLEALISLAPPLLNFAS